MAPVFGAAGQASGGPVVPAPGASIGAPALGSFSSGMMSMAPGMAAGGPMTQDVNGMAGQWGAVQQPGNDSVNPMMLATMLGGLGGKQPQQQPQQTAMLGGGGAGAPMRGLFSQLAPQWSPRQVSRTSGLLDKIIGGL
ncbi:hypothetical protein ACOTJS_19570 [Achromobacter xylosoxidans]